MSGLKPEYNDREILERAAEAEVENRPFNYSSEGVEYEHIIDHFEYEDFDNHPMIMIPNRLKQLSKEGYLKQVHKNRSNTNADYRLSNRGWEVVDTSEPDGPVEDLID
jgi:hypothetical protein